MIQVQNEVFEKGRTQVIKQKNKETCTDCLSRNVKNLGVYLTKNPTPRYAVPNKFIIPSTQVSLRLLVVQVPRMHRSPSGSFLGPSYAVLLCVRLDPNLAPRHAFVLDSA